MSDPRDIIPAIVNQDAAAAFMSDRKRLREERMRWIDANEMPKPMELTDRDGKVIYSGGPFLVGQCTYHEDYDVAAAGHREGEAKKGFIPEQSSAEQDSVTAQLHEVTSQYNQFSGVETRGSDGKTIPLSHKSDHPPMLEGESHEDWFNRVSDSYRTAAERIQAGSGSPGADNHGIRAAAGNDSSRGGPGFTDGAKDSGDATSGAAVAGIPVADDSFRFDPGDDSGDPSIQREQSAGIDPGATADRTSPTGRTAWLVRSLWGRR